VSDPAFDEILRRLAASEIRFVLVGGLAVNAWGVVRGTRDVDVVVAPDPDNLSRLAEMAVAAGGRVQARGAFLSSAPSIAARIAEGAMVQIQTELGSLDIVQGLPGVPSYEVLRSRARETEILGVTVAVCSLEDLKEMKLAAGRARDLADLEDLDAAHEELEESEPPP
jgi:predicted nucleotidyltransferase